MRVPGWWGSRHRDVEIDEELAAHLEMATRDRIERGMEPDQARLAARRELGNVPLIKQATREVWAWTKVEHALQDLRFGARILRQAPALSATAVLLVALVIGANATIYSIVRGILVSPASGVTAERLVAIKHAEPGVAIADPFVSFPNYVDYARLATTVRGLAAWSTERLTLGTPTGNYAVFGALVTANYFDTLGVTVAQGRTFRVSDDEARDGVVAVIGDGVWRDQFGGAPDVVGRTMAVNGVPVMVVGVTAPGFAGALLTPGEGIWLPIHAYHEASGNLAVLDNRGQPLVAMVGQRAESATTKAVAAELNTLALQLRAAFPDGFTTYRPSGVVSMENPQVVASPYSAAALLPMADMAPIFLALFSIVTLLTLLVVSANVANLMLGRAVERQRDTAVRRSLGASRQRILLMLIAEGSTLSVVAWGAACLVAWWTSRLLLQVMEPRPGLLAAIRPDWTLAAYAMLLAGLATVAFTLGPAVRAWRMPVLPFLKSGEASVAPGRSRLTASLVVVQLALSVVLLTSAGLAYRSLGMLDGGHVGFDADRVLLVTVRAGRQAAFVTSAPSRESRREEIATLERVRERLAHERDVRAVSYARRVPGPYALATTSVNMAGGGRAAQAFVRPVGPDYLRTLGLRPLAGRELIAADAAGATRTAVINQHLAAELFDDRPAIGQLLHVGDRGEPVEIVGIAPNALFDGPVHDPRPRYIFIARQQENDAALIDMTFFVRHEGVLDSLTPRLGRAIAEVDPAMPIVSMSTMTARLAQVTELQAQVTTLVAIFALASLIVAGLGQYAVAMFDTKRRTRELGVRMALGASPRGIERSVVRDALRLALPGALAGFVLSAGLAVAFRAALFGVTPLDPSAYAGVFLLITATSVLASYLPARRAGRISVVDALRNE